MDVTRCLSGLIRFALCALLWPVATLAYTPDLTNLAAVPLHEAPAPLIAKARSAPAKNQPLRFASAVPLTLTLADGAWDAPDAATARWRARIYSAGAVSLNFTFARFVMPAGGELWIYDAQGQIVQGPYTAANQTEDGRLWTAIVSGDTAVIEARVPATAREALQLQLSQVNYGTRDFYKAGLFGDAGSCNIDVACAAGDAWPKEKRAAVLLQAGGNTVCSGVMVNNARQDNTPYVLTANHCGIRNRGSLPASSVVVYWLYQSSSCNGNNGDSSKNQAGTSFVATDGPTDFTLLRLNQAPASNVTVHYAGWNVNSTPAQSGAGLHHPSGDVKKISVFNTPLTADTISIDGVTVDAWKVSRWAQGVTEQGSSGSGLWNQDHQLVGLLSGGESDCSTSIVNGTGPDQPDYYGRLDLAWTRGLKTFLDPDNSGVTSLCGRDPGDGLCGATPAPNPTTPGATPADSGGGGAFSSALLLNLLVLMTLRASLIRRRSSRA